jgi:hypothetical protein
MVFLLLWFTGINTVLAAGLEIVSVEEKFFGGVRYFHLTLRNSGNETISNIKTYLNEELVFTTTLKPGDSITEVFSSAKPLLLSKIKVVADGIELNYPEHVTPKGVNLPTYSYILIVLACIVLLLIILWLKRRKHELTPEKELLKSVKS